MVQANQNKNLDVKLSLDLTAQRKSPVVKRVLATDYQTLMTQASTLATKHGIQSECTIKYHDGDSWVIIEDDQDLNLAFSLAQNGDKKLLLKVKQADAASQQSEPSTNATEAEEEVKDAGSNRGGRRQQRPKKERGPTRKVMKKIIDSELSKQAKKVFTDLLRSDELPTVESAHECREVVHENVGCDGCGISPIRGIRYKCSVCKNFDYCAYCEERLGHEHAFLKIRENGGAPDVMITMLYDDGEEEPKGQPNDPAQLMSNMVEGKEGFGPKMFNQMMNRFGEQDTENFTQKKVHWTEEKKGQKEKKDWKAARAVVQNKPEGVIQILPGMTEIVEFTVFNDTHWPWKAGCILTLADEQPEDVPPIDVFCIPVEEPVKGKTSQTFSVPITMLSHIEADDKIFEVHVTFRGPKGCPFGSPIALKLQCVLGKIVPQDVDIYKLAIKLHEELQLGTLDECIKAVRENNGNEANSVLALQKNGGEEE